jgi:hypothetical protein
VAYRAECAYHKGMICKVTFYKADGSVLNTKAWDAGVDTATQHASQMAKPFGAAAADVRDESGNVLFSYKVPPDA